MIFIKARFYKEFTHLGHWSKDEGTTTLCGKKPLEIREVPSNLTWGDIGYVSTCSSCSFIKRTLETSKKVVDNAIT